MTLVAETILFKEALDPIETDHQKNYNTALCIFFEYILYPRSSCQNDKIITKLNAIITWSKKKQLESRMAIPEKLQGNIDAV